MYGANTNEGGVTGYSSPTTDSGFGGGGDERRREGMLQSLIQPNQGLLPGMEGFNVPTFQNFDQAGKFGMNQAGALYGQGPVEQYQGSGIAGFGDYSQQAQQSLQGYGGPDNPFLQGLMNYQNTQNPYLDAMAQQGQSQIADQMNSMFGGSGRGGSGYHAATTGRALGDYQTNLRGNAFDSMMNRNLQAMGMGSQGYQSQYNQGLDYNQALQRTGNAQDIMSQMQLSDEINRFNTEANSGWDNLQKYQNIVSGLAPTEKPERPKSSSTDQMLGLLSIGAGFL